MSGENKRKIRLLPIVIVTAFIFLSMKINVLWNEYNNKKQISSVFVSKITAMAEDAVEKAPQKDEKVPVTEEKNTNNLNPALEDNTFFEKVSTTEKNEFSGSEIEILTSLSKRREEIFLKEKELEKKLALLSVAEQQIDTKIAKLETFKKEIKVLVGEYNENQKNKIDSLVILYSNMKPKDAARIFERLDMDVLMFIFTKLNPKKASEILSAMDLEKAKNITKELANIKTLGEMNL